MMNCSDQLIIFLYIEEWTAVQRRPHHQMWAARQSSLHKFLPASILLFQENFNHFQVTSGDLLLFLLLFAIQLWWLYWSPRDDRL